MSSYFKVEGFDLDVVFSFNRENQKENQIFKGKVLEGKNQTFKKKEEALFKSQLVQEIQKNQDLNSKDSSFNISSSQFSFFQLELKQALKENLKEFKSRLIWKINLSQMEKKLKENPWVDQVFIRRTFPDGISIKVQIFSPVLAYIDESGTLYYVTERGDFIFHDVIWDVPILRGKVFLSERKLLHKVLELIQYLPSEGVFSRSQISDISYNQERGFILYLIGSKVEVRLGMGSFLNKYRHIEYVLKYLNLKGFQARVIDARFSKKVVVSLSNQA